MADDKVPANLDQQRQLYGATIGDSVRTVTSTLGISQAAVARALGVSSPMLSQLASGQRIKLANPQAVHRLQSLLVLASEVDDGLPADQVEPRLSAIRDDPGTTLGLVRVAPDGPPATPSDLPAAFSRLLRAVASGRDLTRAADLLRDEVPEIAELLRAYGTGDADSAARHHAGIAHLL